MIKLLRIKFQSPILKPLLIDTYPRILIEGNWWHDDFWGYHMGEKGKDTIIDKCYCWFLCTPGCPHNHLGRALMHIREELRIDNGLLAKAVMELRHLEKQV